jgi:hypothetical protein
MVHLDGSGHMAEPLPSTRRTDAAGRDPDGGACQEVANLEVGSSELRIQSSAFMTDLDTPPSTIHRSRVSDQADHALDRALRWVFGGPPGGIGGHGGEDSDDQGGRHPPSQAGDS